jgi:hypothetical protein
MSELHAQAASLNLKTTVTVHFLACLDFYSLDETAQQPLAPGAVYDLRFDTIYLRTALSTVSLAPSTMVFVYRYF